MKTTFKSIILASLAAGSFSLCSCGSLMNDLIAGNGPAYHRPPARATASATCGNSLITPGNAYHAARTYHNPSYPVYQAIGRALVNSTLPIYSVGNDPNYQRQAAEAYGHMSGHGRIGGVSLREAYE